MIANCTMNEGRLDRQVRRLRNLLADAWRSRQSPNVIRRIESMIRRRWQIIERDRKEHPRPQPE